MQTVGEILRSEREKKGLSVKDIEAATSIRALYITAIEESNYKIVPGEVYLKGFIRNYANSLGLNGPEMVGLYRKQQTPPETQEDNSDAAAGMAAATTTAQAAADSTVSSGSTSGVFKWVVAGVIVAGIAAGGIWWTGAHSTAPVPPPQQPQQQQAAPPPPQQPVPAAIPPQTRSIVLAVKYSANCWTQVIADGNNLYEGIARKGDSFSWEAAKELTIKLGNADSVDAVYNGQPLGKLGGKGEVIIKTFSANQ